MRTKRTRRILRFTALGVAFNTLLNIFLPGVAWALTGGPSQPETQSFTPAGTSEMVDLFTGDFNYNIPLLDVGGYPINLSYSSGVTMDQEASWTGLGWNANVGVINRNVRGLPDDFKGDPVSKSFNIKRNDTYGVSGGANLELFGIKTGDALGVGIGVGFSYNNYNGYGFDVNVRPSITVGDPAKGTMNAGLGLSAGSESGVGITPNVSFSKRVEDKESGSVNKSIGVGLPFNSRAGLKALTINASSSRQSVKVSGSDDGGLYLSGSRNGGSAISFATPTYTPQISLPMKSVGLNFSATLGAALFGSHPEVEVNGYYSTQFLSTQNNTLPAYGFLYVQDSEDEFTQRALLDFNREKDGSFSKNTPNLPLTNFTYDIYSVAGQGVGGMYRPFRSDLGTVYDSYNTTTGSSTDLPGLEFGGGNAVHLGTNFTVITNDGHSGRWSRDNEAGSHFAFKRNSEDPSYETVFFKQAGEKTAESDEAFFANVGSFDPVRIELGSGYQGNAKGNIIQEKTNGETFALPLMESQSRRQERQRRNQVIAFLKADEAQHAALEPTIRSYAMGVFSTDEKGRYNAVDREINRAEYPKHHVSEMSVLRPDGVRYFYGIPTYNHRQQEVSFSVAGRKGNCADGMVSYSEQDDSPGNERGKDNFYDKVETPAYATSYLLTDIVSPDYVDLTGDGPSDDDYGSYTKINYSRATNNYQWRVPYQKQKASYNEGLKSDLYDGKGSYLYGTKDLWYVHSIETKTHVAEFHLSDRKDGYGVVGKDGGAKGADNKVAAQTTKKLDKIALYAKPDRSKNGQAAEPIKVVHFRYDYSLCPDVPNNINSVTNTGEQTGKLTLREVYFTYGKSAKGRLSPYRFHYQGPNPRYNLKGHDRWGNYKPSTSGNNCGPLDKTTAEFPYVEQNRPLADRHATAWHLTDIDLPSGGRIAVDFESDDYAYVQDRRAMQMFTMTATGSSADDSPTGDDAPTAQLMDENNRNFTYLFFKLQDDIIATSRQEADDMVKDRYIRDIKKGNLYFRFFTALSQASDYEYVPGYTEIESAGAAHSSSNTYTHGYVKLKAVGVRTKGGGDDVNPISKAAWQFTRLYRPEVAYKNPSGPNQGAVIDILNAILSTGTQISQLVEGFNQSLRDDHYGKTFVKNKSVIRLYNPAMVKLGGGSRVKQVAMSDAWGDMSSHPDEANFAYGQVYTYTTTVEDTDGSVRTVSSGVAAYEPILGGDENPFRQPVAFGKDKFLAPSDQYYLEEPFGEMFFPGPTVGYRRVSVRNLSHNGVKRHATGSVIHEFYTAKDFPTITRQTGLDAKHYNPNPLLQLLKVDVKEYMTASQGYTVELNDMHGKPKAQWVFAENQTEPISGMEYHYQTDKSDPKRLDNTVTTITKHTDASGSRISEQQVGVDFDVIADMREQENSTVASGMQGNLDGFLAAILPVTIPVVLPKFSQEEVRFRSSVITKVIQRYGLIDQVVAYDLGASVATRNLLYDAETGEVLLTETQNQYDDPVYSFTYPAHWGYDGMGMAYQNLGLTMDNVSPDNINQAQQYFVPGDKVMVQQQANVFWAWVTRVNFNSILLKDRDGNTVEGAIDRLKIARSGRRNQQTTPIGSVVSLQNPLRDTNDDQLADKLSFEGVEVLNAEAIEFSDQWKQFCQCGFDPSEPFNEYFRGSRGNWRAKRSHLYLTDRKQTRINDNPEVRRDGSYQMFSPFWNPSASQGDWSKNAARWTSTSEVTTYSPYGFELENKDALGRYSSAVYGYSNTLPTAVSNNAQYRETAFDGFEDYDFGECEDDHFSYRIHKENITEEESHSGRRSIRIEAGKSISIGKVIVECQDE